MEKTRNLPQNKLGLLRKTFFTADSQLRNKNAHTLICKFCGQSDSQYHRFWECSPFASARPYPWLASKVLERGLPKCLTYHIYHGWIGLPPEVRELQKALFELTSQTSSSACHSRRPTSLLMVPVPALQGGVWWQQIQVPLTNGTLLQASRQDGSSQACGLKSCLPLVPCDMFSAMDTQSGFGVTMHSSLKLSEQPCSTQIAVAPP